MVHNIDKVMPKVPKMFVLKRGGRKEPVMFDKITSRIQKLCYGLDLDFIDPPAITKKVINGVYSGVTTVELDNLAAETSIMMISDHPDYAILAARIAVSNLHKETPKSFADICTRLRHHKNESTGREQPLISEKYFEIAIKHADCLNSAIIYDRDFSFSYFEFKFLENNYLHKINGNVVERPQQMFMRVALSIHGSDTDAVIRTYNLLSQKWYIHDSATLLKAGYPNGQLASGFCITMASDSIEGICDTLQQCGVAARSGLEVGLNVHCIRATGSYIAGTNGCSNGLVPMLRVYNDVAVFVHQGARKQHARIAIYLEPWHADIFEFISLKKTIGKEEQRAKVLSYVIWVPDLFMKRVEEDGDWCLMCPNNCPGLFEAWGEKFEDLYNSYEQQERYRKKIKARQLWFAILESQVDNGGPSILYKDACNKKSNHKNIGTIKCSSYTTDLLGFSSPDQTPSVPCASISLGMFVNQDKNFDFGKLKEITMEVARNLDTLIDGNCYTSTTSQTVTTNLRPIAIGVQGLADTFIQMRLPFDSPEAESVNKKIFETIYYGALEASCDLAKNCGFYSSYQDSPASKMILQYDLWDATPSDLHDWSALKDKISRNGIRNSVLVALMPTSSTSKILGTSESFEAIQSNICSRTVDSKKFIEVNRQLLRDLTELGIWDKEMESELISRNGSVQEIERIPDRLKDIYKTTWEISQKAIIKMATDRAAFIDQSQALNIHMASPNFGKLNAMHFNTWHSGLKTGIYKLRTKS